MKNFLRVAALAICAILMTANASAQDNYNATTMGEKVYLETANWGQNSPFNKQIFTSYGGSTNAKAGCVPTAYAIVMRYHGFPEEGTAKTLYNCQAPTYVEITDRVYDFSKMPLTNGSGWTEEQQTEVAKFFSHVLHACFPSKIGTGSTEVNEGQTSKVLNDYFNYQLINASYQANFTLEQWSEKLRESISNGCPVPYAANNSGTGDSRHMFVVDGYTTGGYFHFNFGWSGSGNGWFKLDNITPSQGDDYSWNGNSQHYALFNLAPNKTPRTVTATANPSSMGTVSINGGTAGSSVSAEVIEGTKATLTAHPADGYALANWTKNGVIIGTKNPIQVTVGESGNDYVANFDEASNVQIEKTCTFKISDVTTSGISGSYCSTWTTGDGIVLSCTKDSEPAYALSTSVNTFFAKAAVGNSETLVSGITYTLTAPEGYVIKSYSFKGKSPSNSYTIDVTVGGNTTNVTNASAGVIISASDINSQSTSFVLGSTYAGRAGLAILEDGVTVTIQSEGGASTPTPEPTPVTYSVAVTAGNGGTATASAATIEQGKDVTLTATPDTGYEFTGWYNGTTMVSDANPYTFAVTGNINYVANFEAVEQGGDETTDPLAGKYFRLKEKSTGNYMNIANTNNNTGSTSGVTVVAKNESSDTQIFLFEQSGDGYKLKANSGNYIKCHAWNANANATAATEATELTFETTGTELEYLIKWDNKNMNNGVERDDYFKVENNYIYCDAASTAAAVWTVEEVIYATVNVTAGNGGSAYIGAGTSATLEHGNAATLTAVADEGYNFVNWTKGSEVVSTENPYTFNVTEDVDLTANFEEIEETTAGTYYRIAYDFPVAARAAATRTNEETLTLTPSAAGLTGTTKTSDVKFDRLSLGATDDTGQAVTAIKRGSDTQFYLYGYLKAYPCSSIKYTLTAPEGYIITGYSFEYSINSKSDPCTISYSGGTKASPTDIEWYPLSATENARTAEFTITASKESENSFYFIKNFTVTIKLDDGNGSGEGEGEGGDETPTEPAVERYYIQGKACGVVDGTNDMSNALLMTTDKDASSIFYHADNKLLSYSVGTYINEDGNTRGLQGVGVAGGNVTMTITGNTSTIAAPNYMHANQNGSTYFVDHCSSNDGTAAHTSHNFIIEEVPSLPVEITGAGYATLYAPVALEIPAGVTAYTVAIDGEWAILSEIKGGIIPAGTGVVIYSETADTYNFTITTTEDSATSALSGTVSAAYIEEDAYVLTLDSELGVCFGTALKNQQNNTAWLNNSHKAYLPKQMGANAASYSFRFDNGTTVIEEVKAESGKVKAIYDLQGRIVENPSKGLYIINGKKVFVK